MPTLEELKNTYEEKVRREASCGDFLGSESCSNKLVTGLTAYEKYAKTQLKDQTTALDLIEGQIAYKRFLLKGERENSRKLSRNGRRVSTPKSRLLVNDIKSLESQREALIKNNPFAFIAYYEGILNQDLRDGASGRLIDVPYVLEARKRISESLEAGIPVYLVGHLGSGKTQLAEEAAIDFSMENAIYRELTTCMNEWFTNNPGSSEESAFSYFISKYRECKESYREMLLEGGKEKSEKLRPLFISGSHNLTYEDMFVEKTLKLAKSLDDLSYEDYMNKMINSFAGWLEKHREEMETMSEKEQLELKIQTWHTFSSLFLAGNTNFGTVVEKIDREILIAMKEGRPVIIDELNTIAMQNLIALNDILQRHAGSTAYVTGVGPVTIQPGFCFIGTGNMSTNTVNYEGTNKLNPAFQSRFITIEYNYMPQNTVGALEDQTNPYDNQLFRVIIEYLCDRNGSLTLPDPKETLRELYSLAQFARKTQNYFEGREDNEFVEEEKDFIKPELNEAVLSIRNIIHVLDHWNYGEEEDLSMAIWKGFISSVTNPDDLNFLLALAVRYGFFKESRGWEVRAKAKGQPATTFYEIGKNLCPYYPGEYETLSKLDVVHLLFGREPEFEEIPEELRPFVDGKEESMPVGEFMKLNEAISHLEHSSDIWDFVKGKTAQNSDAE